MLTRFRWYKCAGRRPPCENGFLSTDYIEYYRVLLHCWRSGLFWWSNFPHQWQIQRRQVGKGETSRCMTTWKRLPKIKYVVRPQEVTHYRPILFERRNSQLWILPCAVARFPHPWTTTVKSFKTEPSFSKTLHPTNALRMCDGYWMTSCLATTFASFYPIWLPFMR